MGQLISDSLRGEIRARHRTLYGLGGAPRQLHPRKEAQAESQLAQPSAGVASTITVPQFSARALTKLTYGPTASTIATFNALGDDEAERLANFVDWQLDWQSIDDSALESRLSNAGYTTLNKSLSQIWSECVKSNPSYEVRMRPAWEAQRAAYVRATYSARQLHEVLVNFWHDHFNVLGTDFTIGPVFGHYSRTAIRANATGNFRAMLMAVAKSTAMLYFLDNFTNTRAGPNENWARELLELHTFGAENYLGFMDPFDVPPCPENPDYPIGYTDIDVYETAAAFTGWTVKNGHWEYPSQNDGGFVYRQAWHDAGPKFLLGMLLYPEQPALKDGTDVLDRLASHPRVAKFICKKLIRRFISDTPRQSLIDSAAAIFNAEWRNPRQIELTLRHILNSDDFVEDWGFKIRRPFESVVAAMRSLGCTWTMRVGHQKSDEFMWRAGFTGHAAYAWPAPNGYSDLRTSWSGANSFAMSWKMLNWLTETAENGTPLAPIVKTTRSQVQVWTAENLVNYWYKRILGYTPPAGARKQVLVDFMAQNGDPASYVIQDNDVWSADDLKDHYNHQRLRSMVSLILLTPEFLSR